MKPSLLVWVLYQLPEAVLMLYCGTGLLGVKPGAKRFWAAALLFAAAVPLARSIPIPFGLHTALLFFFLIVIIRRLFAVSVLTASIAATLANVLLVMGQVAVLVPVLAANRVTIARFAATVPGQLLAGYLSATALMTVACLVRFGNIRLFTVPEALPAVTAQRSRR